MGTAGPQVNDGPGFRRRARLVRLLDAIAASVALFDPRGTLLHANRPLRRLFAATTGGEMLREEIGRLVAGACVMDPGGIVLDESGTTELADVEVAVPEASYRVRIGDPRLRFGSRAGLLVTVEALEHRPSGRETLQGRYFLSRREVRIAELLAEGYSNAAIAAELHLSPHTVRHHTQSVLQKLGLCSRSQVGSLLRKVCRNDLS
jgi:DNA-binding CsgD family transcriptional regulator